MAKQMSPKQKVGFTFFAPEAQSVSLAGSFTQWEQNAAGLKKQKSGLWKTQLALEAGVHEYRFLVDGQWRDDPACSQRVPNSFGSENCVRVVE